jgi:hypothetical protein
LPVGVGSEGVPQPLEEKAMFCALGLYPLLQREAPAPVFGILDQNSTKSTMLIHNSEFSENCHVKRLIFIYKKTRRIWRK